MLALRPGDSCFEHRTIFLLRTILLRERPKVLGEGYRSSGDHFTLVFSEV